MKKIQKYRLRLVREKTFSYEPTFISGSDDIAELARKIGYQEFSEERMGMFTLNAKGEITGYFEVSHGDLSSSEAHPREVFKMALMANAGSIILLHNHPSGDTNPSSADVSTTHRLAEAGELIGIPLLDHVIVGLEKGYTSMKGQGLF